MTKLHKVLIGLMVAAAIVIPLGIVATAAQPSEPTTRIIRIASDPTNTPSGGPCHGSGC